MEVLVSGSTGFIGSALVFFLTASGHCVRRLVRSTPQPGSSAVQWDPEAGEVDAAGLEGLEGAVHLAAESVAGGRWTPARKARIRNSRVKGTRLLCEALASLQKPPRVVVCASAVGYYGDRSAEILREDSPPGRDFLAELCCDWEEAAEPARARRIRVVNLRIGVVLDANGGALAKMLPAFRMGLGGPMGTGEQYMSWISKEDLLGILVHALTTEALSGPVNAVAPNPVTNREFAKTLGRILRRPAFVVMPAFAARLAFGEMADALLLASQRVEPTRLMATGYAFRHRELESALRHVLGK